MQDLTQPLSRITDPVVANLVGMYCQDDGTTHPWFKRRLRQQPESVQKDVWKWIEALSLRERRDQLLKQRRLEGKASILEEEEWDRLAEIVLTSQLKSPQLSLAKLANRAISQFPKHRQVRLTGRNIRPLVARIREHLERLNATEKRLHTVEAKLKGIEEAPTKREILEGLSDPEVVRHFGERIFQLLTPSQILSNLDDETITDHVPTPRLIGKAIERGLEAYEEATLGLRESIRDLQDQIAEAAAFQAQGQTRAAARTPVKPASPSLPRVALLGPLSGQAHIICKKLEGRARFETVDKNQLEAGRAMPTGCQYVVVWVDFVPPATQTLICDRNPGAMLVRHHGGVTGLVRKLDMFLPVTEGSPVLR